MLSTRSVGCLRGATAVAREFQAMFGEGFVRIVLADVDFARDFAGVRNVCAHAEGLKIYGNGILSSSAEVRHSLTDEVEKLPFDVERIVEQDYDVWHMQPLLFVIDSFDQLARGFESWASGKGLLGRAGVPPRG